MAGKLFKQSEQVPLSHKGAEQREHPRVTVFIAVSCVLLDSDSHPLFQCMGTIKDVSQSGLGIELPSFIEADQIVLTFVDLSNQVVEIKGKIVFSRATSIGGFRLGVRLQGEKVQTNEFVAKVVRHHHYTKNIRCID